MTISETGTSRTLFPKRALWLKDQLQKRKWNKSDVDRRGGPDPKTLQKILDGSPVRQDTLERLADALSKKRDQVLVRDIPEA